MIKYLASSMTASISLFISFARSYTNVHARSELVKKSHGVFDDFLALRFDSNDVFTRIVGHRFEDIQHLSHSRNFITICVDFFCNKFYLI